VEVFESMFRVIKESEYVDERQHCFLIQTFGQNSHYFSVETRQVRSEYRLTERGQTGQGLIQAHRERTDRPGVNTGSQRGNRQVRG
jgi:hypothetical protein